MKGISKVLVLSLIGIIERFSFYTILSVLFLFMTSEDVGFSLDDSSKLYKFFMSCIYFAPIVFGLLADLTNRKIMIGIGLAVTIIGYVLIYLLSGSISGFYVALGITAIGTSIFRPNFLVLFGDTAIESNQKKLVLQGYIIYGLLGSIGGLFSGFLSSYFRVTFGYQFVFLTASLIIIPIILLYYFVILKSKNKLQNFQVQEYQGLVLVLGFFILFLVTYGFRLLDNASNSLIDFKKVENIFKDPSYFDAVIQIVRDIVFIIIGFFGFGILFINMIKVDFKFLVKLLSVGVGLLIVFLIYSNFNLLDISTKSNRLFAIIVLTISFLDLLINPIIRYFIYFNSFKFKGFAFGLYFAQFAIISKFLIQEDRNDNLMVIVSTGLFILLIGLGIIARRKAKLPNNAYSK